MAVLPTGIGPVTGGYQIERSLRFNSADSAYLNRTPASASNRKTWTWSGWVKRTTVNTTGQNLFSTDNGSSTTLGQLFFNDNVFEFNCYASSAYQWRLITTQVWRDLSAWYHIVAVVDTTQATSSNRVKLYVNGTQITAFSTATYPSQNFDGAYNLNQPHYVGAAITSSGYLNGYFTEINFVDGQALTPSDFGETDSNTGVWKPKAYTGTYGTNGFYLKFADNSNTTAATLGKDSSGNGNNWTPNNFSVTAGSGNDSLVDSPTSYGTDTGVGGEVRGNYCTLNPLAPPVWAGTNYALSNGNLAVTFGYQTAPSTFSVSSGKWYWEVNCTTNNGSGSNNTRIGIVPNPYGTGTPGDMTGSYAYTATGQKGASNVYTTYGASFTDGDIIGVALDLDNGTIAFYKNGSSQGTAFTGISGSFYAMSGSGSSSGTVQSYNFGQRAFAYTAPSGFKALCTQNLPTPTIGATSTTQANDYFNPVLYSGNSSTQAITGVGFQPDFVWCKARSTAAHHIVTDAVRTAAKVLSPSQTAAESAWADNVFFQSLNSDGFTLTGGGTGINTTGNTYVAWNWKANGAGSSNTAGTITSTVSANTTSGFSVVTWAASGTNPTIGHGLGAAPSMIIAKSRTGAGYGWVVYHVSLGRSKFLQLNTTSAETSYTNYWGTANPTSTVFGTSDGAYDNNFGDMVAYCFAPVAGYSAFGSYTGNASADGPFVYLGFRPAYVLIKRSSAAEAWCVMDSKREGYNVDNDPLFANLTNTEGTQDFLDLLSNGFKLRSTDTGVNGSGTYIYACFAENPFKYSLAR